MSDASHDSVYDVSAEWEALKSEMDAGIKDSPEALEETIRRIVREEVRPQCPYPHYPQPPVYWPTINPPHWPYGYQVWC